MRGNTLKAIAYINMYGKLSRMTAYDLGLCRSHSGWDSLVKRVLATPGIVQDSGGSLTTAFMIKARRERTFSDLSGRKRSSKKCFRAENTISHLPDNKEALRKHLIS